MNIVSYGIVNSISTVSYDSIASSSGGGGGGGGGPHESPRPRVPTSHTSPSPRAPKS